LEYWVVVTLRPIRNGDPEPVLRRKKRYIDHYQAETIESYDKLIKEVLKRFPWSNVTELAEQGTELKKRWRAGVLPTGKLERKTVREHLRRLQREKVILKIDRQYALVETYLGPPSLLNKEVKSALRNDRFAQLDFAFGKNAAGGYMTTRPELSNGRRLVSGLWEHEAIRFAKGFFGLETLITYAIRQGDLSSRIRSESRIDMAALREWLERSLNDLDLFIFSFAVDVRQLLSYLSTPHGERLAIRILERRWDTIMQQAKDAAAIHDRGLIINRDTTQFQRMIRDSRFFKRTDAQKGAVDKNRSDDLQDCTRMKIVGNKELVRLAIRKT